MRPDELLQSMFRALDEGHLARPDVPLEDLIASLNGPPQSIGEFNRSGEEMGFICVAVEAADYAGDDIVAGSIIQLCQGCFCDVWMSPATCKLAARVARKKILCMKCAPKEIEKAK